MLTALLMAASLLLSLVRFGVLGWADQRTRLVAVWAYLVWSVLNSFALAPIKKVAVDHAIHAGGLFGVNIGTLVTAMNLTTDGLGAIFFLWMLFALVQQITPESRLPGRAGRFLGPSVAEP
jgi:hypothetical protein